MIRSTLRSFRDWIVAKVTPKPVEGRDLAEEKAAEDYLNEVRRDMKKRQAIKWMNNNKWHPLKDNEDFSILWHDVA